MTWLAWSLTWPPAISWVCVIAQRGARAPGWTDRFLLGSPPQVPVHLSTPTAPTLQELGAQGEETVVGDAMGLRGPEGSCSPNHAKNRFFLRATSSLETEVDRVLFVT